MERRGQEGAVLASTDSNRINDKIRGAEHAFTQEGISRRFFAGREHMVWIKDKPHKSRGGNM